MNELTRFQNQKLKKYIEFVNLRRVRATLEPTAIEILEPAKPRFDAPPERGNWRGFSKGQEWGSRQQWAYFRANFEVPAHWQGTMQLRVEHRAQYKQLPGNDNWPAGPEGQMFIDGQRAGAIDQQHHTIQFPFTPGAKHEVSGVFFAGRCECSHGVAMFDLALLDPDVEILYHDLRITWDIVEKLAEDSAERQRLLNVLEAACAALDFRESYEIETPLVESDRCGKSFYASVAQARAVFARERARVPQYDAVARLVAVGHAHIDLAWLWPIKQTRHKCVRTFATQCRLLEQYPDWIFLQSQPQAYAWIEEDAPDLFLKIKDQIKQGRWHADGASWVECDTNLPSGESLVRQMLYGKRYLKEKFGIDSRLLWLPDVFGYTAALPQILRLAGVDHFITSKISWNQYNRFPHDTFRWRGLDGTDVPTHFITTPSHEWYLTYNAMMTVDEVKRNLSEYRQKDLLIDPIMSFGWGDGGGGPTEIMLETALRLNQMAPVAGIPRVEFDAPVQLMDRIGERAAELPVWDGELYLEFHRGTYTSHAWLKRANRKNEIALQQYEWLSSLAAPYGYRIEKQVLDGLWQDLMLMQFHDILPGSSVGEVYRDEVRPMQEHIAQTVQALTETVADFLAARIETATVAKPLVVFNTLSWDWTAPLQMPDGAWRDDLQIPAGGWAVVPAAPPVQTADKLSISDDGRLLENQYWRLELDAEGRITRLLDKREQREILAPGAQGNEWQVFEDRPLLCDAWDIDFHFEERRLEGPHLESLTVIERGPVRAAVQLSWCMPTLGKRPASTITQTIALYAHHPRIDFETEADWHEHHQLLKVAFPVRIRATEATHEIQFGHLTRATHRNTSWDVARFETCAHRFVDLAEAGYGVALLNDCKYGHDIHENRIRLTCIKCAQSPDAEADQGRHVFTYALLPHAGTLQQAGVVRAAAELNRPPVIRQVKTPAPQGLAATFAFATCAHPALVIDTLKPAEDGNGIIVRLYESHGSHINTELELAAAPISVTTVNLLEEPWPDEANMEHTGRHIKLSLKPFQILTLRLEMPAPTA